MVTRGGSVYLFSISFLCPFIRRRRPHFLDVYLNVVFAGAYLMALHMYYLVRCIWRFLCYSKGNKYFTVYEWVLVRTEYSLTWLILKLLHMFMCLHNLFCFHLFWVMKYHLSFDRDKKILGLLFLHWNTSNLRSLFGLQD